MKTSNSEVPKSPETALISDVAYETTPETSPLPSFTANTGLNIVVQNTDDRSRVNFYVTNNFLEYVCEQTNLYCCASQETSASQNVQISVRALH